MGSVIDALRWILVGLGLGVALEMFRHVSAFRQLVDLPDWQTRAEELESENRSLAAQAALIPGLREELANAHAAPRPVQTAPSSIALPIDEPAPKGLEDILNLPADFRARLLALGITSPAQLAGLDAEELRARLDLMPWDTVNPEEWITAAKTLDRSPQPESERPQSVETPRFDQLPGITPDQAAGLESKFEGFAELAGSDESAILAAIDAMPWDMIPVSEWKEYARSKS